MPFILAGFIALFLAPAFGTTLIIFGCVIGMYESGLEPKEAKAHVKKKPR